MSQRIHWVLVGLGLLLSGLVTGAGRDAPASCVRQAPSGICLLHQVSLVQLIANPTQWNGKRVMVSGFLHLEFEGDALYLHKDDYQYRIAQNGLWVEFVGSTKKDWCIDQYVVLSGTFSAEERGHMGSWSGSIKGIDFCRPLERV